MLSLKIRFRRLSAERLTANHEQYVCICIYTCIICKCIHYIYIYIYIYIFIYTLLREYNDILGMLECPSAVYGKPQEHVLNT